MTKRSILYTDETVKAYLAGTLDAEASAALLRAAETDATLAAEIALWRAVRELGEQEMAERPPNSLEWQRIARRIAVTKPQQHRTTGRFSRHSVRRFWSKPLIAPWQAVAALMLALAGWQTFIAPTIVPGAAEGRDAVGGDYYALAGEEQADALVLKVAFVETAGEAQLRQLLRSVDARIVDGPSAIGLYSLAFDDAEALAQARARLSQERTLVSRVASQ